jgi:hypothetical protein
MAHRPAAFRSELSYKGQAYRLQTQRINVAFLYYKGQSGSKAPPSVKNIYGPEETAYTIEVDACCARTLKVPGLVPAEFKGHAPSYTPKTPCHGIIIPVKVEECL